MALAIVIISADFSTLAKKMQNYMKKSGKTFGLFLFPTVTKKYVLGVVIANNTKYQSTDGKSCSGVTSKQENTVCSK